MQVIRQIIDVENQMLKILLPNDFKAEKVEVIILSMDRPEVETKGIANLRGRLNLTEEQYDDFQSNVKKAREAWERDI
jgi:hypothetical protein